MITEKNNNKFYNMTYESGSSFKIEYGRVEGSRIVLTESYSKWDSIYRAKIKKGYKDVTEHTTEVVDDTKPEITKFSGDTLVNKFLTKMSEYTKGLVNNTYSVKATNVTQKQVDDAQKIIDDLNSSKKKADTEVNSLLLDLYMTIPRKMKVVKDHLMPNIDFSATIQQEQDNIDALKSQIKPKVTTKVKAKKVDTFLEQFGITMEEYKSVDMGLTYILDQLKGKRYQVFKAVKEEEEKDYADHVKDKKNKDSRLLIHGTKCTSVLSILQQGLKIRPTGNFQYSGKAYGNGNYYSEVASKSLNYTGYDNDKVFLIYEVHVGNPFTYEGWYRGNSFELSEKELTKRGFDSTYVKAGNGLINSEIIAYNEKQNKLKYIIWMN